MSRRSHKSFVSIMEIAVYTYIPLILVTSNTLASTTLSGAISNASDSEGYLLLVHPLMSQGLCTLTESSMMVKDQGLICQ
jgi:hypothetical protein